MPFITIRTEEAIKAKMITAAQERYLAATGTEWLAVEVDPQTLTYGVVAAEINELENQVNQIGQNALPGPESPHLDQWVATSGIVRDAGESNQDLWDRYIAFRSKGDDTTEPGLELLAKRTSPNVLDIGFRIQTNLSVNVYLVSDEVNLITTPGLPSTELKDAISAVFNNTRTKNITDQFNLVNPTVTPISIYATIHYTPNIPNLAVLQNSVEQALFEYTASIRSFAIKKPCQGQFLEAGTLYSALFVVKDVIRISDYGFRRQGDATNQLYLAGINNGFYSCFDDVNIDPTPAVFGDINLIYTDT